MALVVGGWFGSCYVRVLWFGGFWRFSIVTLWYWLSVLKFGLGIYCCMDGLVFY